MMKIKKTKIKSISVHQIISPPMENKLTGDGKGIPSRHHGPW